jgi:hypothetical protein
MTHQKFGFAPDVDVSIPSSEQALSILR